MKRPTSWLLPRLLLGAALAAACLGLAAGTGGGIVSNAAGGDLSCDVAIVGGGAAGVHTAYQLSKLPRSNPDANVCLVEKEDRLGGRIMDVALDPAFPNRVFGMGALRVMETQEYVFRLANELGIDLVAAPFRDDLISARGYFAYDSDDIKMRAYPLVSKDFIAGGGFDTEAALYDELRFGPERQHAREYPDFRSYVRKVAGTQGYHFLTDVFRFRADFEYPLDARGYLDYLDEEWDVCCTPYYPVGGMSQFITRMADEAERNGVRIFLSEPALEISRQEGAYPYAIKTANRSVSARKLVIAVDAVGLRKIGGDLVAEITSRKEFDDLIGVKVVTIAQQWPSAWWLRAGHSGRDIRRAWTTEHCLNAIEIPIASYAASQLVTRAVYDDDIRCVTFWEQTASRGIDQVEAEILRGLGYLFPDANIPKPRKTVVKVWPAAWYWLRAGSSFTNAEIAKWAIEPLPGEDVSLVGESYNPQRSGWSDGAYKSSVNTLNDRYGFSITIPKAVAATGSARVSAAPAGRRGRASR